MVKGERYTAPQGKRKSPDEKKVERFTRRAISKVDKSGRTRKSKKTFEHLETTLENKELTLEDLQPYLADKPPRKLSLNRKKVYSALWRNFTDKFMKDWWDKQNKPWICHLCKKQIDPKGKGKDKRSIEHVEPWAKSKLGIPTYLVCKSGQHWEVALTEEVRAVLEDPFNLLPAHQGCNSGKGGPTTTDSLAPQKKGSCPGEDCTATKAE